MSDKLPWYCTIKGCENPKVGNSPYCQTHVKGLQKMAKDIKKAQEKKANQKQIAKMSEKRKKDVKIYASKREEHLAKHPNCQIRIMGICLGKGTEVHHSGKRGKNYLNEETYLTACGPCHSFVETKMSAAERREKGFLK